MAGDSLTTKAATDWLAARYRSNGVIRALVQLIPLNIGSAADTLAMSKIEAMRKERLTTFFDELANGNIELTEELLGSEEFLHFFFATSTAALRSRRHEKIKLFAKLLKSSLGSEHQRDADELEELLDILDTLSYTEWQALLMLEKHSSKAATAEVEQELQRRLKFGPMFISELETELGIPSGEIPSFLNRIERTGLYSRFDAGFSDYSGGIGYLTPRFFRLKRFIELGTNHPA